MEHLQYPIGRFKAPKNCNRLSEWLKDIAEFLSLISQTTEKLSSQVLSKTYRPQGWNIAQVVHHCADSHMNSFMRTKLALTEEHPAIRPYFEDRWAELIDGKEFEMLDSLLLIRALHSKWIKLLQSLSDQDLEKTFLHPEHGAVFTLGENIAFYSWHCKHHLAHINLALNA